MSTPDPVRAALAELEYAITLEGFGCACTPHATCATCRTRNTLATCVRKEFDKLRAALSAQPPSGSVEMSPEFTDTARDALLWVLWHHQGGSSPVGQPIRFALGMGAHDRLSDHQIDRAKRWAALTRSTTAEFHQQPPSGWQPIETAPKDAPNVRHERETTA